MARRDRTRSIIPRLRFPPGVVAIAARCVAVVPDPARTALSTGLLNAFNELAGTLPSLPKSVLVVPRKG